MDGTPVPGMPVVRGTARPPGAWGTQVEGLRSAQEAGPQPVIVIALPAHARSSLWLRSATVSGADATFSKAWMGKQHLPGRQGGGLVGKQHL